MTNLVLQPVKYNANKKALLIAILIYAPLWAVGLHALDVLKGQDSKTLQPQIVKIIMAMDEPIPEVIAPPEPIVEEVVEEPKVEEPKEEPKPIVKKEPPKPKVVPKKEKPKIKPKKEPQKVVTQTVPPSPKVIEKPTETVKTQVVEEPKVLVYGRDQDVILQNIVKALKKNLVYPRQAQMKGMTGVVLVSFIVNVDGTISKLKVVKSKASEILNESAIKTVQSAVSSFPKTDKKLKLVIPISYQLV